MCFVRVEPFLSGRPLGIYLCLEIAGNPALAKEYKGIKLNLDLPKTRPPREHLLNASIQAPAVKLKKAA